MSLTRRDFASTIRDHRCRCRAGRQRRRPRHRAERPRVHGDRDRQRERGRGVGGPAQRGVGYGPLIPDPKGLLALPAGFSYRVITYSGKTKLESGEFTPSNHDGTSTFDGPRGTTLLVNNHELTGPRAKWPYPVPLTEGLVYDPAAAGGCTVVEVRPGGQVAEWVGIAGTSTNCAGGNTPWGTWLTCEETEDKTGTNGFTKDHGYVFEVDPEDRRRNKNPKPIKALGRYAHEAVVVDPKRGRALPHRGRLGPQRAPVPLDPAAGLRARPRAARHPRRRRRRATRPSSASTPAASSSTTSPAPRRSARCTASTGSTSPTATPRPSPSASSSPPVRSPAPASSKACGGATAACTSSPRTPATESPGQAHDGAVWFYDPKRRTLTLKVLIGVNPDPSVDGAFDGPDNITVSPYGGLVIAEDGEGIQHLFGATDSGRTYPIARNELNIGTEAEPEYSEFTGVTFSPDGKTLFANIQVPGIMLAITGPWKRQKRG